MRWGIIGLGNIANEFATALQGHKQIYGVSSRNQEKALAFQKKYNVEKVYKSYIDLIEDDAIDVVYIATVNSEHMKYIKLCLENGKHVLCEKAIWNNYQELKEVYDYAQSKELVLAEAMTVFHMPIFERITELINDGELGKVKMVSTDLGSLKEEDPNNRYFSKEQGGGAMLDIGTYALSLIRYFIKGDIIESNHVMEKYKTGVDEMWSISLKTDKGEIGNANFTFRAKRPKTAIIAGEKAFVTIRDYLRADEATITYPNGTEKIIQAGKTDKALLYEANNIEDAINNQDNSKVHIEKTLDVVHLMNILLEKEELI